MVCGVLLLSETLYHNQQQSVLFIFIIIVIVVRLFIVRYSIRCK